MAFDNPPFSVRRGDDSFIEIYVYDEFSRAVSLTAPGTKVQMTYGMGGGLSGPALKTVTDLDMTVSGNRASYRMKPPETLSLKANRTYWLRLRVTFPDGTTSGFRETVTTASFTVRQTADPHDDV